MQVLKWQMVRISVLAVAMLVGLAIAAVPSAEACWGNGYFGSGFGYGYGGGFGIAYGARPNYVPTPPYFALHPPVYYSYQIQRRSYGSSPFAYPGFYAPAASAGVSATSATAPAAEPQWIVNPFVKPQGEPAETKAESVSSVSAATSNAPQLVRNQPVAAIRNPFVR